ncbi:MAG: creatininase family protein [Erysipelotrichaceae bacterium]
MIRNYRDLTRQEMEQVDKETTLILIPLGSIEQHGNHAPLGTDSMIAEEMVKRITVQLQELEPTYQMLIFPLQSIGLSSEHKNFCGSISLRAQTYYQLLYDIAKSLAHHGFKKIAFLNCHGGNEPILKILSRELRSELGLFAFILASGAFSHPKVQATISEGNKWDFHGGEMETSMVMAIDESVVKLEAAEAGIPAPFIGFETLRPYGSASIGWMSEDWQTEDGKPIGIGGDPRGASIEKGNIILDVSVSVIVQGLMEIANWTIKP